MIHPHSSGRESGIRDVLTIRELETSKNWSHQNSHDVRMKGRLHWVF